MTEAHSKMLLRGRARSIRATTTAVAVMVVAAALLIGSVAMLALLRASLQDTIEQAARLRGREVASALETEARPSSITLGDQDDQFVQVIGREGVIASSPNVAGKPRLARLSPGQTQTTNTTPLEEDEDRFLLVSVDSDTGGGYTVLVGRALESVDESVGIVRNILLVGVPVLLALIGTLTWAVVGRTLQPVERIRREVAEISSSQLHRRVPVTSVDDEVSRLARTMNKMLDRLEGAQLRQRRFVSDASHELRSPLATIRSHAEIALAHPETMSPSDLAGNVLSEGLRIQSLVDDLLTLAGLDEGGNEQRRQTLDVDDLVFEEADRLRAMHDRLLVDTSSVSSGQVDGDALQLRSIVRNLADNAARHAASRVAFSLSEGEGSVILCVDDDGAGIDTAMQQQIFDRFSRLDEARSRDGGGTGLGLAIAHAATLRHEGSIEVTRAPLGGARFMVTLPAA